MNKNTLRLTLAATLVALAAPLAHAQAKPEDEIRYRQSVMNVIGRAMGPMGAMAQGKALVSTSLGAEGIEGDDGTHFVLADDANSFAERVIELLAQPAERRRLGEAARARAESHYAWRTLGDRLSDAYVGVVAEHRR